jgi:hypothetical protein
MTKLLVGSGIPVDASGTHFEIIDLSQPQTQRNCTISQFPNEVFAAVGAVIPPVIFLLIGILNVDYKEWSQVLCNNVNKA